MNLGEPILSKNGTLSCEIMTYQSARMSTLSRHAKTGNAYGSEVLTISAHNLRPIPMAA